MTGAHAHLADHRSASRGEAQLGSRLPRGNNTAPFILYLPIYPIYTELLSGLESLHHLPVQVLACLDGYMNIALEQTEEYVNGQV